MMSFVTPSTITAYFNATINPPTTTTTTGNGTEFVSERTNLVARLVEELGGERTSPHTRAISLEDTIDIANLARSHTQTRAGARTNSVGRSDERIGAEVDVEHRTLSTLAEDGLAFVQKAVDFVFAIHQLELLQVFNAFEPSLFSLSQVVFKVQALENLFVAGLGGGILLVEVVQEVAYTQAVATYLISIGRANSLACGTHFGITLSGLISSIEQTVSRHNKVSLLRNV